MSTISSDAGSRSKSADQKSPHKAEAAISKKLFPLVSPKGGIRASHNEKMSSSEKEESRNDDSSSQMADEIHSEDSGHQNLSEPLSDEDFNTMVLEGLSLESISKIASDPQVGYDFADFLRRLSNNCCQADLELEIATKTINALKSIIDFELGWTNKFIDQSVAKAMDIATSNEVVDWVEGNPSIQHHNSVIVSNSATLRISSITTEQMHQFSDYLRRCIAEGVEDKRTAVLSQVAIVQLHRSLLTRSEGRVPVGASSQLWLAWPTEQLAEAVEYTFPRAGQSSMDWLHTFNKLYVELNVRDESSYVGYLNDITTAEFESQYKITPVKQVVKALVANLSKPPKEGAGSNKVTRCNMQMQYELRRRFEEGVLSTIEQYIVQFGAIAGRANRSAQQAMLWDNSIDNPLPHSSELGKRGTVPTELSNKSQKSENRTICQGCGSFLPTHLGNSTTVFNECKRCVGHPDRNKSGSWHESAAKRALSVNGYNTINRNFHTNGERLTPEELSNMEKQLKAKYPTVTHTPKK